MKKILVLAGSNSPKSVNKSLATYASTQIQDSESTILDLNDFEMPLYSPVREESDGIPAKAKEFIAHIESADGIIVSLAEHNGSYSAAFKNLLDWSSRAKQKLWSEKPMLLMSSSPGGRGGATVRAAAENYFPFMGASVKGLFSLPKFNDNFKEGEGVTDPDLKTEFEKALSEFESAL